MKKHLRLVAAIAWCLFLLSPALTGAQTMVSEHIDQFNTDITFSKADPVRIVETIAYNFGTTEHHGIYRTIPRKYTVHGLPYSITISNVTVTDQTQVPYPFTITTTDKELAIRIGDAKAYVTGQKTYVLHYTVGRVWQHDTDHDTFYWNATGNQWGIPMTTAHTVVHLPPNISASQVISQCYSGRDGSTHSCENQTRMTGSHDIVTTISFDQSNIQPKEGLTIAIGLPPGTVARPSWFQIIIGFLRDNWYLTIPIATTLIMTLVWFFYGRDPKGRGVIITQYDAPDGLSPAEIGTIVDMNIGNKDLTSEIIFLATQGYLTITRIEADGKQVTVPGYELHRTDKDIATLKLWQQALMTALFHNTSGILLSQLKYNFAKDFPKIQRQMYKELIQRGYFANNPFTFIHASSMMLTAAFIVIYASAKLDVLFYYPFVILSILLSVLILSFFIATLSRRTEKGVAAREYILGLKDYLTVAEKDRLDFHNAPEKNPTQFEALLPYAIALGVETAWAKQFADMTAVAYQPAWYATTRSHASFNSMMFVDEMKNFRTVTTNNLFTGASPSGRMGSGGGGHSGGGFGGGGGGSW